MAAKKKKTAKKKSTKSVAKKAPVKKASKKKAAKKKAAKKKVTKKASKKKKASAPLVVTRARKLAKKAIKQVEIKGGELLGELKGLVGKSKR